ncbi:MAG: translation initiation factor eif-2b epsilon subunit [Lasallia pustulata]|uniref:Mannose-1-phosphate guanyltransferase n=1 Tax=Lasallia pustulata TaxID=136370 RepID=A0A5M8PQC0_9LECA|nr:MAG: translation initiation factor eif-2b epsilon subunit [Lasallia pustulata]
MTPRHPKGGSGKQKPQDDNREDSLQAVVLADSFETRFNPFTLERPRCLLPLANTPLIEYTLEFLANAGVEDIFIYCGAHTDQVEEYISASKWKLSSSPFRTLTLLKSTATSVGDAMRDLDNRDLITGDFLLVSGDVISNLPIEPALARHRARRGKDKNAIMTMVLREAGVEHRTKSRGRRPVFVVDPAKERCLHYEEMSRRQEAGRYVNIDPELLSTHEEIEIREDLIDCYIDICTPDVLGLWSDNFDYQSLRKSFLFGVLKDYELNGKTIHTYIVTEHYAARVRSLKAYVAVSKDVINRWTYPLCPDSNLVNGQSYRFGRGKIYEEEGVVLARSSVVNKRSVLGRETSIGDGSVVGDSVLGRRCQIGKHVLIEGAYIWDNAVIGDGATIRQAIVANEAVVGKNCRVEPGALISYGVRIADGMNVAGTSRITRANRKGSSISDTAIVGKGGEGYHYVSDSDDDSSDTASTASSHLIYPNLTRSFSASSISTLNSSYSDSLLQPEVSSRRSSFRSDPLDDVGQNRDFHIEATSSILDGLTKGDAADVVQLELLSDRMRTNASDHMVRHAIVASFMKRIYNLIDGDQSVNTGIGAGEAVKLVFGRYKELVERMSISDKDKEDKADQVDFLMLVQKDAVGKSRGENVLLFVAKELYDLEIVEEEGVLQWWADPRSAEGEMGRVRGLTEQFVDWLQQADEEDDEGNAGSDGDE